MQISMTLIQSAHLQLNNFIQKRRNYMQLYII